MESPRQIGEGFLTTMSAQRHGRQNAALRSRHEHSGRGPVIDPGAEATTSRQQAVRSKSVDAPVVATRDRDQAGRARNARARDALGRPLARGVPGVTASPNESELEPNETLAEAQRLIDTGRPFQAHEVLEAAWKHAATGERDLWQGLAQLAVGQTHALRGNPTGAAALLARGADRLTGYTNTAPHRINAAGLISWAQSTADETEQAAARPMPPLLLSSG